jgi:predicted ATP-dependent endonuclease of OLD family
MHLSAVRINNFRRLKNVLLDLAQDISILVGANNSGKTSAAHALQLFVNPSSERFSIHDFNSKCWTAIDGFGDRVEGVILPKITIDLWFHVEAADLHRVIDLLPNLAWQGSEVGLRIEFAATDETGLLARFEEARTKAQANVRPATAGALGYQPPPRTMKEYLTEFLNDEFGFRYYVLDRARFGATFLESPGYTPLLLTPEVGRSGKEVLASLLSVDFLSAQRHLSDKAGGQRAEDLSRHLGRFYSRNLEKRGDDYDAMRALSESESLLNDHLARVFAPMLLRLSELGYPGLTNPRLLIKSALNPATMMNSNDDGTKVYYVLDSEGEEQMILPDRYNGLGFKNLIYMVVELLDRHAQWMDIEENRPPLHLVFIEEPEVHLHAQLQQVFIRKVLDILKIEGDDALSYRSQLVVTTHSPHILYERGFRPVRYFRRSASGPHQTSELLNLSAFYADTDPSTRDFLERYLRLTHCELFFADTAVLVEGNVERLLIAQMIEKSAPRLKSTCLSILEVGGAFGYRFRSLIEFLGLTALIITDIDSVSAASVAAGEQAPTPATEVAAEEPDEEVGDSPAGKACPVQEPGAVTSNQTLIQWLPKQTSIADLLAATPDQRTQSRTTAISAFIRVVYQRANDITWNGTSLPLAGRTLEETFALENLVWCQAREQNELNLRIPRNDSKTLADLADRIYQRVKGSSFKKTDFALALLAEDPASWSVPRYIDEGLKWLQEQVTLPVEMPPAPLEPGLEEVGA